MIVGKMDAFQPAPPAAVSRVLSTFGRAEIESFIAVAIDLLDLADSDPDLEDDDPREANGDELDGTGGEDDFCDHRAGALPGPGCSISDPGGGNVDDEGEAVNEDGGAEIMATLPAYGVDQSRGPINVHIAAQRHDLRMQLADAEIARETGRARHLRNRLRLLDVQEAHLIARNG